ncbi:MAG: class I SAM-dependent methyltransferase [Kutzneria sp.]|nr:class I SAM-dependent methyltransferase [Kutzneria sp.]
MARTDWRWDPSLYRGSAAYYCRGRVAYPAEPAALLAAALRLDGTGRLLDVGCGPGSLTLLLAPLFGEAVGVDADPDMVVEARRRATEAGLRNVRCLHLRAEQLPSDLYGCRLVTFAQSFHWMDRPRVAAVVHDMLTADGACVHVHATTHQGVGTTETLPHPRPPRSSITTLVRAYLGSTRRAGQSFLPDGTPKDETGIYRAAGFTGPRRLTIPGRTVVRTSDDIVASVYSLSSSAPHLFGGRRADFETDLRRVLHETSPDNLFSERMREIAVDIWHP